MRALLIALFAIACARGAPPSTVPPPTGPVDSAQRSGAPYIDSAQRSGAPYIDDLRLHRGALRERMLLTGSLEAERSAELLTPRTSEWMVQLRSLAPEGALVKAGEPVAEFDAASIAKDLTEKRLAAQTARSELQQQQAQSAMDTLDKTLAVERARTAVAKAERRAAIPRDLLPGRDVEENALTLLRARTTLAKAEADLDAQRKSAALESQVHTLAIARAERAIKAAEEAPAALVLRAPRDGLVLRGDNPREGRKLEPGDNLWPGLTVAQLPEPGRLRVRAQLSDVDEGRIAVGQRATCMLDAYPAEPRPCTVSEISPVAREPSRRSLRRSFPVLLALEGDQSKLRPGLSVKVAVDCAQRSGAARALDDALLAPRAALVRTSDDAGALALASGGTVNVQLLGCDALRCAVANDAKLADGLRLRRADAAP